MRKTSESTIWLRKLHDRYSHYHDIVDLKLRNLNMETTQCVAHMHDFKRLMISKEKQQIRMDRLEALLTVPLLFPAFEPWIFI